MVSQAQSFSSDVYRGLLACCKQLLTERDVQTFLNKTLEIVLDISTFERASIMLYREHSQELQFQAMRSLGQMDSEDPGFNPNPEIIEQVLTEGIPVFLPDAQKHTRFKKNINSKVGLHLSVMCLPLSREESVYGILYLDNGQTRKAYTAEIIDILHELTKFIAVVVHALLEHEQLKMLVSNIEKRL
jgi:transcriptional regulator with GAF, ATPase, and Fis domain